jgi:hypothetical protein
VSKQYVVVTIAGDIVHAYGDKDGQPFPTRAKAQTHANRMAKSDEEHYTGGEPVRFHVRQIIGGTP